ncbi:odorant receptor 10 [Bombus fervidus]|uniref:odorant receptor 10 n=1 Tax=Bombus fervidus TaxID=203811 RepID=UPI003AB3EED2
MFAKHVVQRVFNHIFQTTRGSWRVTDLNLSIINCYVLRGNKDVNRKKLCGRKFRENNKEEEKPNDSNAYQYVMRPPSNSFFDLLWQEQSIFSYILVYILIWLLMILPRFSIIIRYVMNGTDARKLLPLPTYYPYNVSKTLYFEIMYAVQCINLLIASFCYIRVDNLFGVLILHICGQLENFRFHLANMKDSRYIDNHVLGVTVEDHIRLIRAINVIENISTLLFFVLLINFEISACIYRLLLITISAGKERFTVLQVVYLFCNFINTFLQTSLYFLAEQMLVSQIDGDSEGVHNTAYECECVSLKFTKAKSLIIIMARSKRPLHLTTGKLFPLTMLTFYNVRSLLFFPFLFLLLSLSFT